MSDLEQITAMAQRLYDNSGGKGPWLITVVTSLEGSYGDARFVSSCPQARAVIDDFGNLQLTEGWK